MSVILYEMEAIMPALSTTLPVIRPITDLRTKMNEVCNQATDLQEPIVLTKNGTAAYVLMDSQTYEAMEQRERTYLALKEAELEEKYRPKCLSAEASDAALSEAFQAMGINYPAKAVR